MKHLTLVLFSTAFSVVFSEAVFQDETNTLPANIYHVYRKLPEHLLLAIDIIIITSLVARLYIVLPRN